MVAMLVAAVVTADTVVFPGDVQRFYVDKTRCDLGMDAFLLLFPIYTEYSTLDRKKQILVSFYCISNLFKCTLCS